MRRSFVLASALSLATVMVFALVGCPQGGPFQAAYMITVENLSATQPIAPIVAATHSSKTWMFRDGEQASDALVTMAEEGNPMPMADRVAADPKVTDFFNVGMPLTRNGTTAGDFSDSVTFTLNARHGDLLSLAGMLIVTNDGFAGIDATGLPKSGSKVVYAVGYDAGSEENTEVSEDLVDEASQLGPGALPGDPNGNASVDTVPQAAVSLHPNIAGGGDLTPETNGWLDPVLRVTITAMTPAP